MTELHPTQVFCTNLKYSYRAIVEKMNRAKACFTFLLVIVVSIEVATAQGMPLATRRHTPVGLGPHGILSQRVLGQNVTFFCTNLPGETPNFVNLLYSTNTSLLGC